MLKQTASKALGLSALLLMLVVACSSDATATSQPQATAVATIASTEPASTVSPTDAPTIAPTRDTTDLSSVFIQLTDPLDEPQFYCLDVPGSGTAVRLHAAIQVHTCKRIETAEDELFVFDFPDDGQIYMEEYDQCLEAEGDGTGSAVYLRDCSESINQVFTVDNDIIFLSDGIQERLCLAADPNPGIATGGPSHLRRDMSLQPCDSVEPSFARWIFGLFDY